MEPNPEDTPEDELLRHAAWIRRLARGLVADGATADDLVQEAYVAALRRPPAQRGSLRPWLARVVRNAAAQRARSGARRAAREERAERPSSVPGPEDWAQRLETERRLTAALAELAEPFRSTLMLRYYEGLTSVEIAARDGVPAGTVRWRQKRALELLRERLDDAFGDRSTWSLGLLPLARAGTEAAEVAAASTLALSGVLAMNALWKVTGAAVLLVAVALGLTWSGVLPRSLVPFLAEPLEPVSFRALELDDPVDEVVAAAPASAPASRRAPEGAPATAVHEEPEPDAEPGLAPTLVSARVVDENGAPLRGALLRSELGGPGARSGSDGRVELSVLLPAQPASMSFELHAPGRASHGERIAARAGEPVFLGTVVLGPGGAVAGRVLDVNGQPIEGARISVAEVELPERELRQRRMTADFSSVPMTETGRDGAFQLQGLGVGFTRLWASGDGYLANFTGQIEVRAEEESYGIEIVLQDLGAKNVVRGIVLDPSGAPVPNAQLDYRHSSETTGTTTSGDSDAGQDGRFEFLLPDDSRLWITARDEAGEHGPASASDVATGELNLVLQLVEQKQVELRVVDSAGEPIERYGFEIVSPDGSFVHARGPREERLAGVASFGRPSSTFAVRVEAPGFELGKVGPLEPEFVDEGVELRVATAPRLHGVVSDADGPVSGARVRLHELVDADTAYARNGFRSRIVHGDLPDRATTDEDGRYLLTVRRTGTFVVRADKAGYAASEAGPLELGASGEQVLDLALGRGGAIEGRVLVGPGEDPGGHVVGITRFDGYARTLRVADEGGFRFEGLTPGPWKLELRDEEILPGRTSTTTSSNSAPGFYDHVKWSCEVFEGETARFDLALAGEPQCRLVGAFEVDGGLEGAWVASLSSRDGHFMQDGESTVLNADGTFALSVAEPGEYWLNVHRGISEGGELLFVDVVRLTKGESSWQASLETGTLLVDGANAWDGEGIPSVVHLWRGGDERFVLTIVAANDEGQAKLVGVPAGAGRLVTPDPTEPDVGAWQSLLETNVPHGGEQRVTLPSSD